MFWKLGKIEEVYSGRDKKIRGARFTPDVDNENPNVGRVWNGTRSKVRFSTKRVKESPTTWSRMRACTMQLDKLDVS